MWGDPERAASLQENDYLATLLYQISSPAHIPWGDQRWQELLHGYDVWVHMDDSNELVQRACQSMAKHAEMSSNLAAFCLHVTRMLRELVRDIRITAPAETTPNSDGALPTSNGASHETRNKQAAVTDFSKKISRVAKGRATAGALLLLQLLSHEVIVQNCSERPSKSVDNQLQEVFTYHTRGDLPNDQPAAAPLLHSILDLITAVGKDQSALKTPEIYDAVVFALQLLFILSGTQLYQPFRSSFENNTPFNGLLEELFRYDDTDDTIENDNNQRSLWASSGSNISLTASTGNNSKQGGRRPGKRKSWTPRSILEVCLEWQIHRPSAPEGSLAHYYFVLAQAAVSQKGGEKPGQDGMYESHMIVQACAPAPTFSASGDSNDSSNEISGTGNGLGKNSVAISPRRQSESHNIIIDATKGVLTLGGKIILLPFRLVSLVVGVLVSNKKGSHQLRRGEMMKKFASTKTSRTRDVLWLSDSIISDLACSLFLLLANNKRSHKTANPFRSQLSGLTDNRWDENDDGLTLPDLPNLSLNATGSSHGHDSFRVEDLASRDSRRASTATASSEGIHPMTLNFESLFLAFGRTLHTEPTALLLYTLLQSSPSFAESLAVRSDLDTLVMPLLRTLYFASKSHTFVAKDYVSKRSSINSTASQYSTSASGPIIDIRSCPFRSLSQLYVIIILLLLFSQDSSFGRDAFKRITVPSVLWYKERHLKNINLGSIILLTLFRSLLFNLNRLNDPFMLNNCCAILSNLSLSVVGLHEYASMRLASVAVTVMKKHAKLAGAAGPSTKKGSPEVEDDDLTSPLAMHEEVAHTMLGVIKQSLSPLNLAENLHLIYALVYHQMDVIKLCKNKALYSPRETERIVGVTLKAASLIQDEGARTAQKALKVLETQLDSLVEAANVADAQSQPKRRKQSTTEDDFTFTYEEEADPEIFFVPYVWDIIVSCTTSTSISWRKNEIRAFALLEEVEAIEDNDFENLEMPGTTGFSNNANADEMV